MESKLRALILERIEGECGTLWTLHNLSTDDLIKIWTNLVNKGTGMDKRINQAISDWFRE